MYSYIYLTNHAHSLRILLSAAGATLHVRPLGAHPCALPSRSSRAACASSIDAFALVALPLHLLLVSSRAALLFESCLYGWSHTTRAPSRLTPTPSFAVRELLCISTLQFESCCAVRELLCISSAAFAVQELLVSSRAAVHFESCLCGLDHYMCAL